MGLGLQQVQENPVPEARCLKRHAGLGPDGLGAIYITDFSNPASPATSTFLNVATDLSINVGNIPSNSARGLVGDKTQPSRDSLAFVRTGKVGMGDLEISEDGNTLYFINLFDKKLYTIDITQYNENGTKPTSADQQSFEISANCAGGEFRPWALKVYNGKVYVGAVCDAQASKNKSDLRAFVYQFDNGSFTQIFDFPLTYPKGFPNRSYPERTGWFPWSDNFDDMLPKPDQAFSNGIDVIYPSPMLTDIEFDIDGSMVLGFGDRVGMQGGDKNYRPGGTSTALYTVNSVGGDILRAFFSNGAFVLENNAKAGPNVGDGPGNNQGPGFGEFYNDNFTNANDSLIFHAEEVMGALALKPGSGEVSVTVIDPINGNAFAGGIRYMDNSTGEVTGAYNVYKTRSVSGNPNTDGTFAKATGLGDVELACGVLEIMEIGNRVWVDQDKDGVQDACEKGLKNVNVALYKGSALIATTKTDSLGEYYFSSKAKLKNGTWSGTGADTMLIPETDYKIVFGRNNNQTSANGDTLKIASAGKFLLTQKDATANSGNDLNDSDAAKEGIAGGNYATISLTTEKVGTSNHTYDAGFYCIEPEVEFAITEVRATCDGDVAQNDGKLQLTASALPYDKFRIKTGAGAFTGDTAYATATAIGTTFPKILRNNVPNAGATYKIRFYLGECCYKDTVITVAPVSCEPTPEFGGWDFTCEDGVKVETIGKGFTINNNNPPSTCPSGDQAGTGTIAIPNGASSDSVYVEAVYRSGNPGPTINFLDADNNSYPASRTEVRQIGSNELKAWVYRAKVPATDSVSVTETNDFCHLQSMVAYVFRQQNGMASIGRFANVRGYLDTVTIKIPLPVLTKPSDITLCVPISELTDDGRLLEIFATAGGISKDTVINGPDATLGTCCVAIPKVKLIDVPVGTDTVTIEVRSKNNTYQSFVVASAISANVECDKKGSLGDFVWKDLNDNGKQDDDEPGVDEVKVVLTRPTTRDNRMSRSIVLKR